MRDSLRTLPITNDNPVGNRLMKLEDGAATTYTYDVANQLQTNQDAIGTTNYIFDANGNQQIVVESSGTHTTWFWNYENQPTLVTLRQGQRLTMGYNADSHRMLTDQPDRALTRFVWDQVNASYLMELDDSDELSVVYTAQPVDFGSLTSERRGNVTHWIHSDVVGSTRQLTAETESTSENYIYDAWGRSAVTIGGLGRIGKARRKNRESRRQFAITVWHWALSAVRIRMKFTRFEVHAGWNEDWAMVVPRPNAVCGWNEPVPLRCRMPNAVIGPVRNATTS